jgi:hypothetical protein
MAPFGERRDGEGIWWGCGSISLPIERIVKEKKYYRGVILEKGVEAREDTQARSDHLEL